MTMKHVSVKSELRSHHVFRQLTYLLALALLGSGCAPHLSVEEKNSPFADATHDRLTDSVPFQDDSAPPLSYNTEPSSIAVLQVEDAESEIQVIPESNDTQGSFKLSITDSPDQGLEAIYVRFTRVELKEKKSGKRYSILTTPTEVNLLNLQNGLSQVFGELSLPIGTYHQLRFFIDKAHVILNGKRVDLHVSFLFKWLGLHVIGSFEVKPGSSSNVTIDFDVKRMLVWTFLGPIFRPVAKLRHIHLKPAGIHFETVSATTLRLVGPARSVRAKAWIQVTLPSGEVIRQRAASDGSFVFENIPRVYGQVEFAVLAKYGEISFNEHRNCAASHRHSEFEQDEEAEESSGSGKDKDKDNGKGKGKIKIKVKWLKLAWMNLLVDFAPDDRFPHVLASHLDRLLRKVWISVSGDVAQFINEFNTDAFRFLAAQYVMARGHSLPAGFTLPTLSVPYAFELDGPDYELPGYAAQFNDVNYAKHGPDGPGCSDAEKVFEGSLADHDYGSMSANDAIFEMVKGKYPFSGLMAEFQAVCKGRDLAALSCATLGSLAEAGNNSLPAETLNDLDRALNSPRGGLITGLLSCVRELGQPLAPVAAPEFPSDSNAFQCWFGCPQSSQDSYLAASQLLPPGNAKSLIGNPENVLSLDDLVNLADEKGVHPLVLAASYIADEAPSRVHGYVDRNAPRLGNLLPVDQSETDSDTTQVSGISYDRTLASVWINGKPASISLGDGGLAHIASTSVDLEPGMNEILINAVDDSGNETSVLIRVKSTVPPPEPEPSSSPSPDPSPTPTGVAGVSDFCAQGSFVPKSQVRVGMSVDPDEGSYDVIASGFNALGYPVILYTDQEVADLRPITDGMTVLVIARKVILQAVSQAYIDGVKAFIASGGGILGEYDGAALVFNNFTGGNRIIPLLTPPLALFTGDITGGGAVLPVANSTVYVTDPDDPLMSGVPSSFLMGVRSAFAVTGFNDNWIHTSANFVSAGTFGLLPAGTYPAVMSARCGPSRVVMLTMTHLQVTQNVPASTLVNNALNWLVGR